MIPTKRTAVLQEELIRRMQGNVADYAKAFGTQEAIEQCLAMARVLVEVADRAAPGGAKP